MINAAYTRSVLHLSQLRKRKETETYLITGGFLSLDDANSLLPVMTSKRIIHIHCNTHTS